MTELLLVTLIVLLLISYWLNRGDIISPSFIFCASFLFASTWATIYANRWDLTLHNNTYFVISLGVAEFILVSYVTHIVFNLIKHNRRYWVQSNIHPIEIQKGKYIFFITYEIITIVASAIYLVNSFGRQSLTAAIFIFRYGATTENISMPTIINLMRTSVNASAYWFSYVLANNMVAKRKLDFNALTVIILATINTIVVGSRGNIIYILIDIIVIYIIKKKKSKRITERKLSFKSIIIAISVLVAVILSYQSIGNLLGRQSTANSMDYLATYCGAEIKNLDMMLQRDIFSKSERFGEQTFINLYKWLGPRFGITNTKFALSFLSVNGYNLGNVYTIFYPFIYDFGYAGIGILVLLMAIICQVLYEKIRFSNRSLFVDSKVVAYGYMFSTVLFSYFSNKFYEQIFSAVFIYSLIIWYLYKKFFFKIRFKIRKKGRYNIHNQIMM